MSRLWHKNPTAVFFTLAGLALLLLASPFVWDAWRVSFIRRNATAIRVGDTKARVKSVLGEGTEWPIDYSLIFGRLHEDWSYGSRFDWSDALQPEFPFVSPFRLRFGPDKDDVVITFDNCGRVSKVDVPAPLP